MIMTTTLAGPFAALAEHPLDEVGGKGRGLAVMAAHGFPVSPGFVVTGAGYQMFLDDADLRGEISRIVSGIDPASAPSRRAAAAELEALIEGAEFPAGLSAEIGRHYTELSESVGVPDVSVAVRSSASAEDSADDSFAGEFESWIGLTGEAQVLAHIKKCYQSLYADRVLAYMLDRDVDPASIGMAVVVQKTVQAQAAGVMFTLDPVTGDRSSVVIEANWGIGLSVVGGEAIPDRFVVDKVTREIRERVVGAKEVVYIHGDRGPVPQTEEKREQLCLTDEEVLALVDLGCRLEKHYGGPQDIEFATDEQLPIDQRIRLLQCRPETIWQSRRADSTFSATGSMMSWVSKAISNPDDQATPSNGHSHG